MEFDDTYLEQRRSMDDDPRQFGMDDQHELGDHPKQWMPITEYGRTKGVGSREVRAILADMGLLQPELELRMVPMILDPDRTKPEYRSTLRLTRDAVVAGLGRRLASIRHEFDVLTPEGQRWADERWPAKVKPTSARYMLKERVRELLEEGKTQAQIAQITGKSRQLVSHHVKAITGESMAS